MASDGKTQKDLVPALGPLGFKLSLLRVSYASHGALVGVGSALAMAAEVGVDSHLTFYASTDDLANVTALAHSTCLKHLQSMVRYRMVSSFEGKGSSPTRWRFNQPLDWRCSFRGGREGRRAAQTMVGLIDQVFLVEHTPPPDLSVTLGRLQRSRSTRQGATILSLSGRPVVTTNPGTVRALRRPKRAPAPLTTAHDDAGTPSPSPTTKESGAGFVDEQHAARARLFSHDVLKCAAEVNGRKWMGRPQLARVARLCANRSLDELQKMLALSPHGLGVPQLLDWLEAAATNPDWNPIDREPPPKPPDDDELAFRRLRNQVEMGIYDDPDDHHDLLGQCPDEYRAELNDLLQSRLSKEEPCPL